MEDKGFFASLFDFSFSSLITLKIIKLLYILSLVGAGIYALIFVVAGFASDSAVGVIFLILSPLVFLLITISARVYLEVLIVVFKIADNTGAIAENTKTQITPN